MLFFVVTNVFATKRTATQSGNWNQTSTWGDMSVPGCFDTIVIPAGITVTITVTVNLTGCPPVYILVQGTLIFQSGKKMNLPNGSIVYIAPGGQLNGGGGGGNSNWIEIAGSPYWTAGDGNVSGSAIFCQSCALPIELISFNANLFSGLVEVDWATATETDNDFFEIQRSGDGLNWEVIEVVDGAENSSSLISYAIEDRAPLLGLSYYRLKQVDMNGAFSYSDTRVISNGEFFTNQQMLILQTGSGYQQNVVIYFSEAQSGPVSIYIAAINGGVIYSQTLNLDDQKWVVISIKQDISSGIYFIKADQKVERAFLE